MVYACSIILYRATVGPTLTVILRETSGYTTWFTAGGAIRIAHYDVIDDVITRKLWDREKRRPPRRMKSSELSNGGNRIAVRQLLQNRKLRHLW